MKSNSQDAKCLSLGRPCCYGAFVLAIAATIGAVAIPSIAQEEERSQSGSEKRAKVIRQRKRVDGQDRDGERRERGDRRDGERRERGERDRKAGERRERGDRQEQSIQRVLKQLRSEVAALRREVAQLRQRVDGRRPRPGFGDRGRAESGGDRVDRSDRGDRDRRDGGQRSDAGREARGEETSRVTPEIRERAEKFFRQRDQNRDKKLSLNEMLSEAQRKKPATLAEAQKLFKRGDRNGDGAWSIEEFIAISMESVKERRAREGERRTERRDGERRERGERREGGERRERTEKRERTRRDSDR